MECVLKVIQEQDANFHALSLRDRPGAVTPHTLTYGTGEQSRRRASGRERRRQAPESHMTGPGGDGMKGVELDTGNAVEVSP